MKRVADWLADNVKTILVVALVILATDSGPALGSVVGYWRMETDTDTGAAVSVPNEIVGGNPLTTSVAQLYGAVPVDPVPLTGQANSYSINPNSQSIEGIVNPYAALDADSITVEFYARTTEGAGDLVTRTYGSAGFKITDFNSVDVTYYVDDGGGGSQAVTINTSHDMDADWDHMAWTYDQSTGVGRFFANGQQVGTSSSTTPGQALVWTGVGNIIVGHDMSGDGYPGGTFDELRISDEALDPPDMLGNPLQPFQVDFGANVPQNVQEGFEEFTRGTLGQPNSNINGPVSETFNTAFGNSGTVTVTVDAEDTNRTIDFRDRGNMTYQNIGDLVEDLIKAAPCGVEMILEDLAPGRYQITTWHHDLSRSSVTDIDILANDALGTDRLLVDNLTMTIGTSPAEVASATFEVVSNGVDPIRVLFAYAAGAMEVPVNGFRLISKVPEPSSLALLGICLLGLAVFPGRNRIS